MRDARGIVIATLMAKCTGLPEAFHDELIAIKDSLHLIQEVKPEKVVIESNSSMLVNVLRKYGNEESEPALNIKYIQDYLQGLPW